MRSLYTKVLLGILVLAVVVSSISLIDPGFSLTGMVVGVPSGCISSFELTSVEYVEIPPGGMESIDVTISEVLCGLSRAKLELIGIPEEYYTVSPTYIVNIAPGKTGEYTIYFDIPENVEPVTYTGTYRLYSNEGRFDSGELGVEIVGPEKPKAFTGPTVQISGALEPFEEELRARHSENVKFWWALGVGSALLAIIIVGSEYFKRPVEELVKVKAKTKSKEKLKEVLEDYRKATIGTGKKRRFFAILDKYRKKKSKQSKA